MTNLFLDTPEETAQEKQAKRDLIATLVAGITASGGLDAAMATNRAIASIDNNFLTAPQIDVWVAEMKVCEAIGGDCGEVIRKYEELSIQQQEELVNYCALNPGTCGEKYGWVITDSLLVREAVDRALGESIPTKMVYDLTALVMHQRDAEGAVASTEFAQQLQEQYGWSTEQSEQVATAVLGSLAGVAVKGGKKGPYFKNNGEARIAAEALGYRKINETVHGGQAVFKKGGVYITRDLDGHNGGAWKMAKSVKDLSNKSSRIGTYDSELNRIGD